MSKPSARYPRASAMFPAPLEEMYQRFADEREDFLLDYGYNTARAYWVDLDDWLLWCVRHDSDPLGLVDSVIDAYLADLQQAGYAHSTRRRRESTLRRFRVHVRESTRAQLILD